MIKKILLLLATSSLVLSIALNSSLLTIAHASTAWAAGYHVLSSSNIGNRAKTAHQPMITPTLATTPTGTPAPIPTPVPTMAPTSTPSWTCTNPLNNVTVSNPTLSVEDTFTIDRDIVHGSIYDMRVASIEQDEDDPIIEAVDERPNQYRALRTGIVTMTVSLDSEVYCTAGDSGSGYFNWVYGSTNVIVTVMESPVMTPTTTPVDEDQSLQLLQHRIYLPFAQR